MHQRNNLNKILKLQIAMLNEEGPSIAFHEVKGGGSRGIRSQKKHRHQRGNNHHEYNSLEGRLDAVVNESLEIRSKRNK